MSYACSRWKNDEDNHHRAPTGRTLYRLNGSQAGLPTPAGFHRVPNLLRDGLRAVK